MLDEMDLTADIATPSCKEVAGYHIADDYYYHMGHSWARFEHGGRVRVGLDEFAACVFGYMDRVDLPPLGAEIQQDRVGWVFRREANRAAVLAPVSGTVLAVNQPVREHPQLVNADPYGKGWLFIVEPDSPKRNLKKLYFGTESRRWLEIENRKLLELMGPEYEGLSASGGSVVRDVFGAIEHLRWGSLAARFLHTKKI
jgi:glycine cleavage system H lipoate-binding protein